MPFLEIMDWCQSKKSSFQTLGENHSLKQVEYEVFFSIFFSLCCGYSLEVPRRIR